MGSGSFSLLGAKSPKLGRRRGGPVLGSICINDSYEIDRFFSVHENRNFAFDIVFF